MSDITIGVSSDGQTTYYGSGELDDYDAEFEENASLGSGSTWDVDGSLNVRGTVDVDGILLVGE